MTWYATASAVTSPWFTGLVALIVGLGGGGGLAALIKLRPERGRIVIDAAQGAVVVQATVIDDLQDELARVKAELAAEREARQAERAEYQRELTDLRSRVARVENGGGHGDWAS